MSDLNFVEKKQREMWKKLSKDIPEDSKKWMAKIGDTLHNDLMNITKLIISIIFYYWLYSRIGFEKTIILLIAIVSFTIDKNSKQKKRIYS